MGKHLTYANVTATLALFIALGSGAYAINTIGSKDIRNGAVRSADLRNGRAVAAQDVRRNALGPEQIDEKSLDASRFVGAVGKQAADCDPNSLTVFVECARATAHLNGPARLLVIATGNEETLSGAGAAATCDIRIDGAPSPLPINPGESGTDNTSGTATDGFARTFVTPDPLSRGPHTVALACKELASDVRIDAPTIAAIAINEP
jgi:hypothetical protein